MSRRLYQIAIVPNSALLGKTSLGYKQLLERERSMFAVQNVNIAPNLFMVT